MSIPNFEVLRAKKDAVQQKRKAVAEKIQDIEKQLIDTFADMEIFASGTDVMLEQIGEDDHTYGHFAFGKDGLSIAYRDTAEDFYDNMNNVPDEYRGYKTVHFSACKTTWLERASGKGAIESLLTNIERQLDDFDSAANESIETLATVLEHQATELNEDTVAALSLTGSETLSKEWSKARSLVSLDPAESITRSSSYLESLCKFILKDLGWPLPKKDTISSLIGECIQVLPISNDETARDLLRQLIGNFRGIFTSVGAIRNQFATAHGASPGDYEMGVHEARLVNNAAAAASTFLLHCHSEYRKSKTVR